MEDNIKETIKLKGSSGKPIVMSYDELANRRIDCKVEFYNGKYFARITRWYRLEEEFDTLHEATSALVKLVQKIDKIKIENKTS